MSFMDAINQAILNTARQQGAIPAAPAEAPVQEAAAVASGGRSRLGGSRSTSTRY